MGLKTKFKCRYCGKVFDTTSRTEKENELEADFWNRLLTPDERKLPLRYCIHFAQEDADNPHIGFGELIGFKL